MMIIKSYKLFDKLKQFKSRADKYVDSFSCSRYIYTKCLGGVYLIAFLSLGVQVQGLFGKEGIMPIQGYLSLIIQKVGEAIPLKIPTIFWLNSSDTTLIAVCIVGGVGGCMMIAGIYPRIAAIMNWIIYGSFLSVGAPFLHFQWDILLMEMGFLSIFFLPWKNNKDSPISTSFFLLLQLLLFRIIFMAGFVKLNSGDPSWQTLAALNFHYWTQPLPHIGGWIAQQLPPFIHSISTLATLIIECIAPFTLFMGRRIRYAGLIAILILMVLITLTGNYGFFTLQIFTLSILWVDNKIWKRYITAPSISSCNQHKKNRYKSAIIVGVGTCVFGMTVLIEAERIVPRVKIPYAVMPVYQTFRQYGIVGQYGLFAVMTTTRKEIVLEGSKDGKEWIPISFKYKSSSLKDRPRWVQPHMPRLDWQMWFAALSPAQTQHWYYQLQEQLLKGSKPVESLLGNYPFDDKPPVWIRGRYNQYMFNSISEYIHYGTIWKTKETGLYSEPIRLK